MPNGHPFSCRRQLPAPATWPDEADRHFNARCYACSTLRASSAVLGLLFGLALAALSVTWIVQSDDLVREAAEFATGPVVPPIQTVEPWALLVAGIMGIAGGGAAWTRRNVPAALILGAAGVGVALLGPPFAIPRLATLGLLVAAGLAAAAARRTQSGREQT